MKPSSTRVLEPAHPHGGDDERFVLRGVPWEAYVTLRDGLDVDGAGVRMTYLDGTLELMSPSAAHEEYKKVIARLLETYAEEHDVDLRGFGGATFREQAVRGGLEPDECFSFTWGESAPDRPDLAIEVVVGNPLADKLEVYRRLGVPEVWIWSGGVLTIQRLGEDAYAEAEQSGFLPGLDRSLLARFVRLGESHTQLVKQFRQALRRP